MPTWDAAYDATSTEKPPSTTTQSGTATDAPEPTRSCISLYFIVGWDGLSVGQWRRSGTEGHSTAFAVDK